MVELEATRLVEEVPELLVMHLRQSRGQSRRELEVNHSSPTLMMHRWTIPADPARSKPSRQPPRPVLLRTIRRLPGVSLRAHLVAPGGILLGVSRLLR